MRKTFLTIFCMLSAVTALTAQNLNTVLQNARRGLPSAMNQLGVWYYTGNNVERDYGKAYYWWSRGALEQNPKAIANLGVCYQFGRGVQRDSTEAIRLYVAAIVAGQDELLKQRMANVSTNAFDAMLSGLCLEKGIGIDQDLSHAAECYESAAAMGSVDGMTAAGIAFLDMSDPAKAFRYLHEAASKGDARAQYLSGKMLMGGMGVPTDKPKALALLRKSATAGNADAQNMLGMMSLKGDGVYIDEKEAMKWLKMSARNGSGEGMWNYATALMEAGDFDGALFWFANASQAGYLDAFGQMANSLPDDSPFGDYLRGMIAYRINGDLDLADSFFKKVEKAKIPDGKVMRAIVLADSRNPKSNPGKAQKNLEELAASSPHAATALARILLDSRGTANSKVISLLRTASEADYGEAANMLGDIYFTGRGSSIDRQGAAALYKKAFAARCLGEDGRRHLLDLHREGVAVDNATARDIERYIPADNIIPMLRGSY